MYFNSIQPLWLTFNQTIHWPNVVFKMDKNNYRCTSISSNLFCSPSIRLCVDVYFLRGYVIDASMLATYEVNAYLTDVASPIWCNIWYSNVHFGASILRNSGVEYFLNNWNFNLVWTYFFIDSFLRMCSLVIQFGLISRDRTNLPPNLNQKNNCINTIRVMSIMPAPVGVSAKRIAH